MGRAFSLAGGRLPDVPVGPGHAGRLWAAVLAVWGGGAWRQPCLPSSWACLFCLLQNVRIDPSSLSFNMWKEIPVPFYLSVYFFDIVNPDAILLGEKPQVQERGPYVYR